MTDMPTRSELIELVKRIDTATTPPEYIYQTAHAWINEMQKHPENFYMDDNGELRYLGWKIVVLDDDNQFTKMADEIIK